jgi:hypothetical protein
MQDMTSDWLEYSNLDVLSPLLRLLPVSNCGRYHDIEIMIFYSVQSIFSWFLSKFDMKRSVYMQDCVPCQFLLPNTRPFHSETSVHFLKIMMHHISVFILPSKLEPFPLDQPGAVNTHTARAFGLCPLMASQDWTGDLFPVSDGLRTGSLQTIIFT